jgi:hypothetical protein
MTQTQTEAVGVFETAESLQDAIDELLNSGFDRAELSLLASEQAVAGKLGHIYDKAEELEDDPEVPTTAYVAPESVGDAEGGLIGGLLYVGALAGAGAVLASGGAILTAVLAATAGGGGGAAIGTVLATLLDRHQRAHIEEQLEHGGMLLWVRTRDDIHEKRAVEILSRHSAHDVHLHRLPVPEET